MNALGKLTINTKSKLITQYYIILFVIGRSFVNVVFFLLVCKATTTKIWITYKMHEFCSRL